MRLAVVLAIAGALAVATGAGLIYMPAGLIVAGVELFAGSYITAYLGARRATS